MLVQDAIFGRPLNQPGMGAALARGSQLSGQPQVRCAHTRGFAACNACFCGDDGEWCAQVSDHDEDSDDAPVVVDATELGVQAYAEHAEDAPAEVAAPTSEPALSWREKALLLRQQRQA